MYVSKQIDKLTKPVIFNPKLNNNGDTSEKTGKSVYSLENKENNKGNEGKKDIENKLNEIKKEGGEN